jgi:hypothetical protein
MNFLIILRPSVKSNLRFCFRNRIQGWLKKVGFFCVLLAVSACKNSDLTQGSIGVTQPNSWKINSQGDYIPFRGLTIVAPIASKADSFWVRIYEALQNNDLVKSYYSPLPLNSYHMTTTNLFVEQQLPRNITLKQFVDERILFFQRVYTELNGNSLNPVVKVKDVSVSRAIQLRLMLEDEQINKITNLAESFNLQENVPSYFHITLAYLYRELPQEKRKQIQDELDRIVLEYLPNPNQTFTLNPPQLCFFQDMKAFLPWDGSFNSFF